MFWTGKSTSPPEGTPLSGPASFIDTGLDISNFTGTGLGWQHPTYAIYIQMTAAGPERDWLSACDIECPLKSVRQGYQAGQMKLSIYTGWSEALSPAEGMDPQKSIFLRDAHLVPLAAEVLHCIVHLQTLPNSSAQLSSCHHGDRLPCSPALGQHD